MGSSYLWAKALHIVFVANNRGRRLEEHERFGWGSRVRLFDMCLVVEADTHELARPRDARPQARVPLDQRQRGGIEQLLEGELRMEVGDHRPRHDQLAARWRSARSATTSSGISMRASVP